MEMICLAVMPTRDSSLLVLASRSLAATLLSVSRFMPAMGVVMMGGIGVSGVRGRAGQRMNCE
jgi:hypothetical protein